MANGPHTIELVLSSRNVWICTPCFRVLGIRETKNPGKLGTYCCAICKAPLGGFMKPQGHPLSPQMLDWLLTWVDQEGDTDPMHRRVTFI